MDGGGLVATGIKRINTHSSIVLDAEPLTSFQPVSSMIMFEFQVL